MLSVVLDDGVKAVAVADLTVTFLLV
jgi:hypothetical protein